MTTQIKKMKRVSNKYFVSCREDGFIEIKAEPVEIAGYEQGDFFVHRQIKEIDGKPQADPRGYFTVSDGRTGTSISRSYLMRKNSKAQAVESAKEMLYKAFEEPRTQNDARVGMTYEALVEKIIREHGLSPRWAFDDGEEVTPETTKTNT